MESRQYPRYVVRDQDGRIIGIAVCNLEVQEPQKPLEPKDQTSVGKESALQDPPTEREQI